MVAKKNPEWPGLPNVTGPDRKPSEFGGDDGLVQPASRGAVMSAAERARLARMVDPMDATGQGVDGGTQAG